MKYESDHSMMAKKDELNQRNKFKYFYDNRAQNLKLEKYWNFLQ